jgi:polyisoprenoid-binding protein YceI
MKRRWLAVPALVALALWPTPGSAAEWEAVVAHSRLAFSGTQAGIPFDGRFERYVAEVRFDPEDLAASRVTVTIDTASAATGDKQRDAALPQSEWFHVGAFPQARFETLGFRHLGGDDYEAAGRLTIRDATKDVLLPFRLEISGDQAVAEGSLTLVRTDYGVGQPPWNTGQWVALEVKVMIRLIARRIL